VVVGSGGESSVIALDGTRARIVTTASELFARSGIRAVGINEIWQTAGIAKSTLYQHFRSKDDLVEEVVRVRYTRWCDRLRDQVNSKQTEAPLLAVFDVLDEDFAAADYRGSDLVNIAAEYPDVSHPVRAAIRHHRNELRTYLTELARDAGASDADGLAGAILALADGATCARLAEGDTRAAKRAGATAELLIQILTKAV
jgi:AcrR family transcriptional regulator